MYNSNTKAKLIAYSSLASSILAVGNQASAQSLTYSFDPDSTLTWDISDVTSCGFYYNKSLSLDLTQDGPNDLFLRFSDNYTSCFGTGGGSTNFAEGLGGVQVAAIKNSLTGGYTTNYYDGDAKRFMTGDQIGSSLYWKERGLMRGRGSGVCCVYNWGIWGFGESVLGLRFPVGDGDYLYGWLRLAPTNSSTIAATLSSYEINAIPNQPITVPSSVTTSTCAKPSGLTTTILGPSSVTLSWNPNPDASIYKLEGKVQGTPEWLGVVEPSNSRTISGLTPGESYKWRVRTICLSEGASPSSVQKVFSLPTLREAENEISSNEEILTTNVFEYNDGLLAEASLPIQQLILRDISGRELVRKEGNWQSVQVQANLPAGVYLLEMLGNDWRDTKKVVVR